MEKIKIKLKECCLTCEHYYPDGIVGAMCGPMDGKREIRCLHMPVCQEYNNEEPTKWGFINVRLGVDMWACGKCGKGSGINVENIPFNFCPHCGERNEQP